MDTPKLWPKIQTKVGNLTWGNRSEEWTTGLMKQLNPLAIMTIIIFEEKDHKNSHEAQAWQHYVVRMLCTTTDWYTSQNRWYCVWL